MTKKLASVLALAAILAAATTSVGVIAKWGPELLGAASRVVAAGPFMDNDG